MWLFSLSVGVTSVTNVLFCPQPKDIQFTVRKEEINQEHIKEAANTEFRRFCLFKQMNQSLKLEMNSAVIALVYTFMYCRQISAMSQTSGQKSKYYTNLFVCCRYVRKKCIFAIYWNFSLSAYTHLETCFFSVYFTEEFPFNFREMTFLVDNNSNLGHLNLVQIHIMLPTCPTTVFLRTHP